MNFEARLNPEKFEKEKEISPVDELLLNLETELYDLTRPMVQEGELEDKDISFDEWSRVYEIFEEIQEYASAASEKEKEKIIDKLDELESISPKNTVNLLKKDLVRVEVEEDKQDETQEEIRAIAKKIGANFRNKNIPATEKFIDELKNKIVSSNNLDNIFLREVKGEVSDSINETGFGDSVVEAARDKLRELKEFLEERSSGREEIFEEKYSDVLSLWRCLAKEPVDEDEVINISKRLYEKFDKLDNLSRASFENALEKALNYDKFSLKLKNKLRAFKAFLG